METRNNTAITILITLLVVAVLGLTGFIVYDKVLREDSNNNGSNMDNGDNSSNEASKYSYKLIDATLSELQKLDSYEEQWNDSLLGGYGWTGGEIECVDNKTFKFIGDSSNTIKLNNKVINWIGTATDESWAIALVMDNGEVYTCDLDCLKNADSEKDMKLLLIDDTILNIGNFDYELFVKTTSGIKKIVPSK